MLRRFWLILPIFLFLQACGGDALYSKDEFHPIDFADIKAWETADFTDTAQALRNSCASLRRANSDKAIGGAVLKLSYRDWQEICRTAPKLQDSDMQSFLQAHFRPLSLARLAFFTGYFEAHLNVSKRRDNRYRYPVLASPGSSAVATSAAEDSPVWVLKAATAEPLQVLPKNYDRKRIETRAESGEFTILFWSDSAIDLFLAQIQGSARITFPDGRQRRIGFAAHNKHNYVSIGKYLLDTQRVESLPDGWFSIRDYLHDHADEAQAIMWQNPRYIFFRLTADDGGPYGRLRTPLIADRSAAADAKLMPFGVPIWTEPEGSESLNIGARLMFIHDTGAAIKGIGRTDLFFGAGDSALNKAARLRNKGKLYILVPKKYIKRVNLL